MKGLLGIYDINPDGIIIEIEWAKFLVGSSLFIPCLNTREAVIQFRKISKQKGYEITYRVRIENGRYGVRIWRDV